MDEDTVRKYAKIKQDGSILLGNNTVCDGADSAREIGVFTHIHRDHTELFNKAMHECSQIFVSLPTLDLLAALDQDFPSTVSTECYFKGRHIHPLNFDTPIVPKIDNTYGDKITLFASKHILGSSQVLVETTDGTRIVYTGDFGPDVTPIPCDILVIDSTHGDPMFNTVVDRASLERRLAECVDEEIRKGKSIMIRAHRGRLQYIMHLLSNEIPRQTKFLCHPTDIKLINVYEKYGMPIRGCINFKSWIGEDIHDSNTQYVEFRSHGQGEHPLENTDKMTVFSMGGRYLGGGTVIRHNPSCDYSLEFMDHANYDSIIEYVRKADPKYVVTDHVRGKQGEKLARDLNARGFKTISYALNDVS